jgi:uncharacterized protein
VIELRRTIELPTNPPAVWATLWDVPALARCIPGCGDVTAVEERRRYRASVKDRVGPFTITMVLDVVVEATPPCRLDVRASGRDVALGSPVTMTLVVTLEPGAIGGTRLVLDGTASVGGRLATLGQSVIQRRTKDILDRFAVNLAARFDGDAAAV